METTITTSDFYLASYLIANDVLLVGHVRESDRSTFEFKGLGLDALVSEFYHDSANVSPLAFAKAIRNLKNIMYSTTTFHNKSTIKNERKSSRKEDECLHS